MRPRVGVATIKLDDPDGTFTIGRDDFPQFGFFQRLGVHVQSDLVKVAEPDPAYVKAALRALAEACEELDVPEASIAFVDTVVPPPAYGLRFGFKGAYTTEYRGIIWIFANWTSLAELRETVRHRGRPPGVRPDPYRRGIGGSFRAVGGLRQGVREGDRARRRAAR